MDRDLPSYSRAISQDPWPHIAPYIRTIDLPAVARVCHRWNVVFMPMIWGKPSTLFGRNEDGLYISLARFKKALQFARQSTRRLTHTLHLPPAHPELYYGPNADWLRMMLGRLPNLQSLLVAGNPCFDHRSLEIVQSSTVRTSDAIEVLPSYHLKMLDASNCTNATSSGLATFLLRLPGLIYLDLSHTKAAGSATVLQAFKELPLLQVLKLRAVGLQSRDVHLLAKVIGKRVRSLDLRDNNLGEAVQSLTDRCFMNQHQRMEIVRQNIASMTGEWSSKERTIMLISSVPALNNEAHDVYLRNALVLGFVESTGNEQFINTGISHLKLSDTSLDDIQSAKIISAGSLLSLDLGYIGRTSAGNNSPSLGRALAALSDCGGTLTYLRINHDLITRDQDLEKHVQSETSASGLYDPHSALSRTAELDAGDQAIHELDTPAVFELPADDVLPAELDGTPIRQDTSAKKVDLLTASTSNLALSFDPIAPPRYTRIHVTPPTDMLTPPAPTPKLTRTYSNVEVQYQAYVESRPKTITSLHPFMLPNLEILVLTRVPARTTDAQVARRITIFIEECATERYWAQTRANVDYALPPGRRRNEAKERRARSHFALHRIVLEVEDRRQTVHPHTPMSQSSVEDPDCETLWSAAKDDFSFFNEDTEESGQPASELIPSVKVNLGDKFVVVDQSVSRKGMVVTGASSQLNQRVPLIDVVAEIARFRKDARQRHAEACGRGGQNSLVKGYWDGEVTVVRQNG